MYTYSISIYLYHTFILQDICIIAICIQIHLLSCTYLLLYTYSSIYILVYHCYMHQGICVVVSEMFHDILCWFLDYDFRVSIFSQYVLLGVLSMYFEYNFFYCILRTSICTEYTCTQIRNKRLLWRVVVCVVVCVYICVYM